jgi:hypothetical protein
VRFIANGHGTLRGPEDKAHVEVLVGGLLAPGWNGVDIKIEGRCA